MIKPIIDSTVFLAKGCAVYGDVTIGKNSSIWYNATVRAMEAPITIGENTNIQDNAVVHVAPNHPVSIGDNVTIGHTAIIHGCSIDDNTLIGMGAIILNGASIGKNCIIGAGALVTQNSVIPDHSLVLGSPGKIIRQVTQEEAEDNLSNATHYVEEIAFYQECEKNTI